MEISYSPHRLHSTAVQQEELAGQYEDNHQRESNSNPSPVHGQSKQGLIASHASAPTYQRTETAHQPGMPAHNLQDASGVTSAEQSSIHPTQQPMTNASRSITEPSLLSQLGYGPCVCQGCASMCSYRNNMPLCKITPQQPTDAEKLEEALSIINELCGRLNPGFGTVKYLRYGEPLVMRIAALRAKGK